jgi:hypothetical protein
MHRNRIGALMMAGGLVLVSLTGAWAAENLSAATKRLFDAVWTDDMARVRASIIDGADLTAINEFGVRAVDMAVDKGHYDIAHYLLSVEKQRNDQKTLAQPVPVPVPTPLPSSAPAPQPVPTPLPVATVAPAPISDAVPMPVTAPASTPKSASVPTVRANEPVPQPEALWKPADEGGETSTPKISVLGTASPQPLSPVPSSSSPSAATQATPQQPGVLKQSLQPEEDKGVLGKVKDFFNFSSKSKAQPEIQNAPPTTQPAPKPAKLPVSGKQSQVTAPEVSKVEVATNPVPEPPPPQPSPQVDGPALMNIDGGSSFFGKISDFFKSGVAPDNDAKDSTSALNEQIESQPEVPQQVASPVENVETITDEKPALATTTESITESEPIVEPQSSDGPSLFDRVAEIFKVEEPSNDEVLAAAPTEPEPAQVTPEKTPLVTALASEPMANEQIAFQTDAQSEAVPITETETSDGSSLFDRVAEIFKVEEPSNNDVLAAAPTEPEPAQVTPEKTPLDTALAPEPVTNEQIASESDTQPEAVPITETESSDGPSLFDRVAEIFKVEEPSNDEVLAAAPTEPQPAQVTPKQTPLDTALAPEPVANEQIAFQSDVQSEVQSDATSIAEAEISDGPSLFDRVSEIFNVEETSAEDVSVVTSTEQVTPPASPESIETPVVETPKATELAEVEPTAIVDAEPETAKPSDSIIDSLSKWLSRDAPEEQSVGDVPVDNVKEPELLVRETEPTASASALSPQAPKVLDPEPRIETAAESPLQPKPLPEKIEATPVARVVKEPKSGDVRVVRPPVRTPKTEMTASVPAAEPKPKQEAEPTSKQAQEPIKSTPELAVITPQIIPPAKPRRVNAPALGPVMSNPAHISEPMIASASLKDVVFKLGDATSLGIKLKKGKEHPLTCVDKSRWQTEFCIEKIIWPKAVAPSFFAESSVYRGEKAIVQYVNGLSVQLHALFPVKSLWTVTEHFKKLYGPPTEMPEVWTALIGEPKRPNRVLRWHSRDSKTGIETLLEIREIDDLRWSSAPDTKHGVVRILDKDRGSVFQLLSSTDLLLVSLRNAGR